MTMQKIKFESVPTVVLLLFLAHTPINSLTNYNTLRWQRSPEDTKYHEWKHLEVSSFGGEVAGSTTSSYSTSQGLSPCPSSTNGVYEVSVHIARTHSCTR